jgi:hypothetical protein
MRAHHPVFAGEPGITMAFPAQVWRFFDWHIVCRMVDGDRAVTCFTGDAFRFRNTGHRIVTGIVTNQACAGLASPFPSLGENGVRKRLPVTSHQPDILNVLMTGSAIIS